MVRGVEPKTQTSRFDPKAPVRLTATLGLGEMNRWRPLLDRVLDVEAHPPARRTIVNLSFQKVTRAAIFSVLMWMSDKASVAVRSSALKSIPAPPGDLVLLTAACHSAGFKARRYLSAHLTLQWIRATGRFQIRIDSTLTMGLIRWVLVNKRVQVQPANFGLSLWTVCVCAQVATTLDK